MIEIGLTIEDEYVRTYLWERGLIAIDEDPKLREWVDLTDDEMLMIYGQQHEGKKYSLGRMVQQALKEKNT